MYKLYYSPGACSKAPHVLLHEMGAEHEAIRVNLHSPAGKDQALLAVNPRHQVPVLDDNDTIVREGAAILIYLADKEESFLLPQSGPERARVLEWLCFFNATVHPVYSTCFGVKGISDDANVQNAIISKLQPKLQALWNDADQHLAKNKYLGGDAMSVADILMAVIAQWKVPTFETQVKLGSNVMRVIDEITSRPAWQQATDMEQAEQKAAA